MWKFRLTCQKTIIGVDNVMQKFRIIWDHKLILLVEAIIPYKDELIMN